MLRYRKPACLKGRRSQGEYLEIWERGVKGQETDHKAITKGHQKALEGFKKEGDAI